LVTDTFCLLTSVVHKQVRNDVLYKFVP